MTKIYTKNDNIPRKCDYCDCEIMNGDTFTMLDGVYMHAMLGECSIAIRRTVEKSLNSP